jgi:cytidine deaminase
MKKIEQVLEYQEYYRYELDDTQQSLVNYAVQMCDLAYAPYSKFKVGAAILFENGEMIGGSNQENIAFPSGLCAERVAIFSASAQYPSYKINVLALVCSDVEIMPTPCGACRQVFSEQIRRQKKDFDVIMASSTNAIIIKASKLLPLDFEY